MLVLWLALAPVVSAIAIQGDLCLTAIPIGLGTTVGSNYGAIVDAQARGCSSSLTSDVFFVFNGTATGMATIAVSSGFYLYETVFNGPDCAHLGTADFDCTYGSAPISIDRYVFHNQLTYFAVGSDSGTQGYFNVTISLVPAIGSTPGDSCANAVSTSGNSAVLTGSFTATAPQEFSACNGQGTSNDVFVTWNATCTGDATVVMATTDNSLDIVMGLFWYTPFGCADLLSDNFVYVCVDDFGSGETETGTFPVVQGLTYYITAASNYNYQWSNVGVTITCAAPTTRPANDLCVQAQPVTDAGMVTGTTTGATRGYPVAVTDHMNCYTGPPQGVWYSYKSNCTGQLTVTTNTTLYGAIFSSCNPFVQHDVCEYTSTFTWAVQNQSTFYINLGQDGNTDFTANFTCTPVAAPANDMCAGATAVTVNTQYMFNVAGATTDVPTFQGCQGNSYNDIFMKYTSPCSGQTTIYTSKLNGSGSSDVYLAGYIGSSCAQVYPPVVCVDITDTYVMNTDLNTDYYLSIGFYSEYDPADIDGLLLVNFSCSTLPPSTAYPTLQPTPAAPTPGSAPTAPTNKAPTPPTSGSTPTAPTNKVPTAPTAGSTPTAPTNKVPTAPTNKASPTAPTNKVPTAPTAPTNKAPSTSTSVSPAGTLQVGFATFLGFLLFA